MALRLARFWSTSPQFWLNLQSRYDLAKAEAKKGHFIRRKIRPAPQRCRVSLNVDRPQEQKRIR